MDAREELIIKYVKNKEILDLGVGDVSYRFLHRFISDNAKKCIGIELDPARAAKLRKAGFNIEVGNAETYNAQKKFDAVVAGDLIEHLDNPGAFLDNVRKHLKDKGVFICNTPNAYAINFLLRGFVQRGNVVHFDEHVNVYTEQLLKELFKRHGLKVTKVSYFTHKEKTIASFISRSLSKFVPMWRENILVIATR